MSDPTIGEAGGLFAGVVALLAVVGKGVRWWLGWTDRRAATRAAKLDAWHHELELREQRLDAAQSAINEALELRVARLEAEAEQRDDRHRKEVSALLGGYQIVAAELRTIKPDSEALTRADELLSSVFPLDPSLPAGMVVLLTQAKRSDEVGPE